MDAFTLGDAMRLGLLDHTLTLGVPVFTSPLVRQTVEEECGIDPCSCSAGGKKLVINQADILETLKNMRRFGLTMGEAAALALAEVAEGSILVARFPQGRVGIRWLAERLEQRLGATTKTITLLRIRWGLLLDGGPRIVDDQAESA